MPIYLFHLSLFLLLLLLLLVKRIGRKMKLNAIIPTFFSTKKLKRTEQDLRAGMSFFFPVSFVENSCSQKSKILTTFKFLHTGKKPTNSHPSNLNNDTT